jgi:hypothetical protein
LFCGSNKIFLKFNRTKKLEKDYGNSINAGSGIFSSWVHRNMQKPHHLHSQIKLVGILWPLRARTAFEDKGHASPAAGRWKQRS